MNEQVRELPHLAEEGCMGMLHGALTQPHRRPSKTTDRLRV